ncbi:MAG: SDR family NAD(P)-dependent oxidoreductase [Chloroflexota bacterium]|nr:SDR family NAD(P)-dependent oxidoreductase [Chloroflexota bacterium]MBI5704399.1 SDR family NAD(P)-dependent oxidoreductase [Chloroflexota bacterium]
MKEESGEWKVESKKWEGLAGKVVLITGAGKGSGRRLALAFAEYGAIVAANDISPINVEEVVAQIQQQGGRAQTFVEDVAKKMGAQGLIKQVEDEFGRIDVLVNHAAVQPRVPLLDMDEWDWHRTLDVTLTGAFLMTQSAGRVMRSQGSGVIINLVTLNQESAEKEAAFVSAMHGLAAFTHQAARELSPYGVRVHLVETGEGVVEKVLALLEEI